MRRLPQGKERQADPAGEEDNDRTVPGFPESSKPAVGWRGE
jgi:hypothetical protein